MYDPQESLRTPVSYPKVQLSYKSQPIANIFSYYNKLSVKMKVIIDEI